MNLTEQMTAEEIHSFGIQVVLNDLEKNGYKIVSVNAEIGMNPQIVAKKEGQLAFVAVRTACYPGKGQLEENVHFQMMEHADKFGAIPYFASVGIANAGGRTETEMGTPVKGAGFYVSYEGLLVIARSDCVRILDNKA